MVKRPQQFESLFQQHNGHPLSEDMGEAMARWADGSTGVAVKNFRDGIAAAKALDELAATWLLVTEARQLGDITAADHVDLAARKDRRKAELAAA